MRVRIASCATVGCATHSTVGLLSTATSSADHTTTPVTGKKDAVMRPIAVVLVSSMVMVLGSGCATPYMKLPKPEEFKKPVAELKAEYPDLRESVWSSITIFGMPEAGPLKEAWGEPHDTGSSIRMLNPLNWIFHPSTYWYWKFEDKQIAVLIDRPLGYGYYPHVMNLRISAETNSEVAASETLTPPHPPSPPPPR